MSDEVSLHDELLSRRWQIDERARERIIEALVERIGEPGSQPAWLPVEIGLLLPMFTELVENGVAFNRLDGMRRGMFGSADGSPAVTTWPERVLAARLAAITDSLRLGAAPPGETPALAEAQLRPWLRVSTCSVAKAERAYRAEAWMPHFEKALRAGPEPPSDSRDQEFADNLHWHLARMRARVAEAVRAGDLAPRDAAFVEWVQTRLPPATPQPPEE